MVPDAVNQEKSYAERRVSGQDRGEISPVIGPQIAAQLWARHYGHGMANDLESSDPATNGTTLATSVGDRFSAVIHAGSVSSRQLRRRIINEPPPTANLFWSLDEGMFKIVANRHGS